MQLNKNRTGQNPMEDVLHYLQLMNQYYEKFLAVTLRFIEQVDQSQWDDIDYMVDSRDRILNIIKSYDKKIALRTAEMKLSDDESLVYRAQVKQLIQQRQGVADKIFAADLDLIARIDEIKTETIKELKHTVETNQRMNAFTTPLTSNAKTRKDV